MFLDGLCFCSTGVETPVSRFSVFYCGHRLMCFKTGYFRSPRNYELCYVVALRGFKI